MTSSSTAARATLPSTPKLRGPRLASSPEELLKSTLNKASRWEKAGASEHDGAGIPPAGRDRGSSPGLGGWGTLRQVKGLGVVWGNKEPSGAAVTHPLLCPQEGVPCQWHAPHPLCELCK